MAIPFFYFSIILEIYLIVIFPATKVGFQELYPSIEPQYISFWIGS